MDFRELNLHFECISTGISPFLEDSGDSDGEMPPLVLRAGALVRIRGLQKVGKIREFHEQKKGDFTVTSPEIVIGPRTSIGCLVVI